jgi:hypothetical protein
MKTVVYILHNIKYVERWVELFFNIWSSSDSIKKIRKQDRLDDRNVQLYYKRVNIVSINFYRYNATENNKTNCG